MVKYKQIHIRKVRNEIGADEPSKEKLLAEARRMIEQARSLKSVQDELASLKDTSIRIDLTGTPEVVFTIAVRGGELQFTPGNSIDADLAIGLPRDLFLEIARRPRSVNVRNVIDNTILRKGRLRHFMALKSFLLDLAFGHD